MSVNKGAYLKQIYNATTAMGDKVVSSDAFFEIEGAEDLGLLIKQFPWPELSSGGEIEVPMPMGGAMWQPQQAKIHQQGGVTLMETKAGHVRQFLERILGNGGTFNAKVYEGKPDDHTHMVSIRNCFFQIDPTDRDWENRGQIMLVSGTLFYHFFGADA